MRRECNRAAKAKRRRTAALHNAGALSERTRTARNVLERFSSEWQLTRFKYAPV
jgi:hypothetical protein